MSTQIESKVIQDLIANRPAANDTPAGYFFLATDTDTLYINKSTGAATRVWVQVALPVIIG